jgi:outer membrane receptor protein involved in Fe transport
LNFDQLNTGNNGAFGLGIATFLLGDVSSFQRFVSSTTNAIGHQYRTFFYGQDSWRVNPKLTVTGGVRWEIYTPEAVPGKGDGGFADLQEGVLRVAGYGNIGLNGNVQNTLHAFAPRLSLAYQFDSKTVLRMGYGRSFDLGVFGSNFGHAVTQNLPVLAAQDISDASLNAAAANNRSAVFNLGVGPQHITSPIFSPISAQGVLQARYLCSVQTAPRLLISARPSRDFPLSTSGTRRCSARSRRP